MYPMFNKQLTHIEEEYLKLLKEHNEQKEKIKTLGDYIKQLEEKEKQRYNGGCT